MRKFAFTIAFLALCTMMAGAQTWTANPTTTLTVQVPVEAALSIDTSSTTLTTSGTTFANPFIGTTAFHYKIRTSKTGGTGTIQAKVTADFDCSGGPCLASPPTTGDALTYTCTVSSPGTACTGTQTAAVGTDKPVASFTADAKSTAAGNTGSVSWSLTNDPKYSTGNYDATVQFTISAT
jgi:hypothetical protein